MSFNFVFDRRNDSRPYPNLAPMMTNPHESYAGMGDTYPRIAPCRLLLYCADHGYPCNISYMDEPLPDRALYPIGLAWFDFELDYFAMIPVETLAAIRRGDLTVLFYYHEGDTPYLEKNRLDGLCLLHDLPTTCYRFITGNTAADNIENFIYFPDHELFYWRNGVLWNGSAVAGARAHTQPRYRRFTMLSRIHKWWRATIVAYFKREGLFSSDEQDLAYWSYNYISINDQPNDNPIMLEKFPGLEEYINVFLAGAPYTCDNLTADEHNQHWLLAEHLYSDSYLSVVLETLYDAEGSNGAFLTEKTFKAIRNAHPFIIFGCPGSVATLRRLGYRTFDQYIDNSYDLELNNTIRFLKATTAVRQLIWADDPHAWYLKCLEDIEYNQQLFVSSKYNRLAELNTVLFHGL